jgi:hypothetical protein
MESSWKDPSPIESVVSLEAVVCGFNNYRSGLPLHRFRSFRRRAIVGIRTPPCPKLFTREQGDYERGDVIGTGRDGPDLLLPPRWLDDISEGLDQLDPIIVVSRHSVPFFVLLNGPYAWMREQLEGGSNLFGGWDIV